MKIIAISLFVLGVVSAGSVVTSRSGSSNGPAAHAATASGALQASGFGGIIGAPLSNSADCFEVDAAGNMKQGWEEDCEGWEQDECHNDVHIAHAGEHASGDAVSESHLVA